LLSFNKPFFFQAIDCCGSDLKEEEEPAWKERLPPGSDQFVWRSLTDNAPI
jgi:hypothetical protein